LSGGAAVTAGVSTALSGAALMGSQVAIDSGNKQAAKALQYSSIGLSIAALVATGFSLAPVMQEYWAVGLFSTFKHWYDTTNLWEAAAEKAIADSNAITNIDDSFSGSGRLISSSNQLQIPGTSRALMAADSVSNASASVVGSDVLPESVSLSGSSTSSLSFEMPPPVNRPFEESNLFDMTHLRRRNIWQKLLRYRLNPNYIENTIAGRVLEPPRVLNWGELQTLDEIDMIFEELEDDVFSTEPNVP
jgi:hypothetical protein